MSLIDKIIPHLTPIEKVLFDEAMQDIERTLEHYGQMGELAIAKKLNDIRKAAARPVDLAGGTIGHA